MVLDNITNVENSILHNIDLQYMTSVEHLFKMMYVLKLSKSTSLEHDRRNRTFCINSFKISHRILELRVWLLWFMCLFPAPGCGMAIVSWVRVCRDGGRVRTYLFQLPARSSAMHEVSHDLLFTAKLLRPWGEVT